MRKDWDLTGWRRLARDTEAEGRKWQTVERALRPNWPIEDSLRKMEDVLYPNRQIEKLRLMEDALHSNRQIEKLRLMEDVLHPNRQTEKLRLMEDALHPNRQIEKSLRQLEDALRPNQRLQDALRHIQAGQVDWAESLEARQRQLRALFETQQREFQRSRDVLARQHLSTSLSTLQATLRHLIDQNASALRADNVSIGPDGEVLVAGEAIAPAEVAASLTRLTEGLAAVSTLSDYLRQLLSFFASLTGPLKTVLLHLLLPYLIAIVGNLTTPMIQDYWKHFVGTSRKEAVLAVQEVAKSKFDATHLEKYRFVKATRLRVHAGPEGQDDIIAEMAFGKVVRVLDSKGQRTQVEFLDDACDESCLGWVASRYLAAFSK